ncbi:MAG: DNA topoisomerase (ATP-hydrolyzing) subunit B [Acutalibacteraceae bacterium]|nr:DNA topoisomerase (ATP-hydrolyzing) subunit B [Acutalibacteraceae bacterium]
MSDELNLPVTEKYDESSIQVLEGLEAVRKRPGMYIGSTGERGLHHLVYEIVDNSIDEALAGYCTKIEVDILDDGIIRVCDNGRGIPVGINAQKGIPTVTVVFTILHAGGKFGGGGYKVSGGLHGVGASVVNALSNWLEVEVRDGKNVYKQRYEKGIIVSDLEVIGTTDETGTTVTFKPDPTIFTDTTTYDYDTLLNRLREQAFLNAGIRIVLNDKRTDENILTIGKSDDLCFEGGIKSYVEYLLAGIKKESIIDDVIYLSGSKGDETAEIALLWSTAYDNKILSFANTLHTIDGGTHEQAFRQTVTRVVNKYAHDFKKIKESSDNLKADDIMEGLVAVVSVKLADAQFESQTKAKLGNTSVGQLVRDIVNDQLYKYFEENPNSSKIVIDKAIAASNAREAAQKAREASRNKAGIGSKTRMPEKLTDCISNDPTKTEIYIVEGDSAGGSAVEGRNATYQAILPLWGKMLNVEKAREDKVYGNDKLTPVITALGTGIGENFDINKLRYDKIVIMADADVDGSHIRTLLLTFFFRYMPELIETGHIYLAQPPLYRISKGKKHFDVFTDEEKTAKMEELGAGVDVQRYKGLGEMDPSQLWETTLDPERRTFLRVNMADAAMADETFTILMGEEVEPRRKFIEENAIYATDLDI